MKKISITGFFILMIMVFSACNSDLQKIKNAEKTLILLKNDIRAGNINEAEKHSKDFQRVYKSIERSSLSEMERNRLDSLYGAYIAVMTKQKGSEFFNSVKQHLKGMYNEMVE